MVNEDTISLLLLPPSSPTIQRKPPIYDVEEPPKEKETTDVLTKTESSTLSTLTSFYSQVEDTLESWIKNTRHSTTFTFHQAKAELVSLVDRWVNLEKKVIESVASIHDPKEEWVPNLVYIAVATFTGSFITRNKSFLTRYTLPPVCFVASSFYFLPNTSNQLYSKLMSPFSSSSSFHSSFPPNSPSSSSWLQEIKTESYQAWNNVQKQYQQFLNKEQFNK